MDYCYMGWRYCPELIPSDKFKGLYHGINNHNKFFPYDKRKEIYLQSTFALGFQSDENIFNKHVSQRIFEGMAYGCIVLTNSIPACEQTNQIAVYIESREDLEDKMNWFLKNPNEILKKQREGYEFVKLYGTNYYSISKIKEILNIKLNIII